MSIPKCPACGSENLTRPTEVKAHSHGVHASFVEDRGWLPKESNVYLEATLCGSCGHASLFASATQLEKLRDKWDLVKG